MNEPSDTRASERLTIPLHEETLEPHVRTVETGFVRVHKRVDTEPYELLVDTARDEVTIERVTVDRPVDVAPQPWQDGETLVIPVVEEVIVTETRLVVREEIRISRRRVTEQLPIAGDLRKERVEIEQIDYESPR